jgi:hypothetical protein
MKRREFVMGGAGLIATGLATPASAQGPTTQRIVVPNVYSSSGARLPENSELRRIAYDVLGALKYAICVHAVDAAQPVARGSGLDRVVSMAIRSMRPEKQRRYREVAAELLAAGPAVRRGVFGRYASIDPDTARRLGVRGMREQLPPLQIDPRLLGLGRRGRGGVRLDQLEATWGLVPTQPFVPQPGEIRTFGGGQPGGDTSIPWPGYHKTVQFRVRELHCVDETNPEFWGSDEIAIGGVAINRDGTTTKVAAKTYNNFDDGNSEWFNPFWKFGVFTRPPPVSGGWGYETFAALVALAEKDGSGFGAFLDELWDKVKEEVLALITAAVAGASFPFVGPYSVIVGIVAAWAVSEAVNWILGWFQDDIFPLQKATMTVPKSGIILWGPGTTHEGTSVVSVPEHPLDFYGAGGHYQVKYDWYFTDWVPGSGSQ